MAEALYRKYRPQIFEDVVGQEPIERTLKNAIAQDKVSHAYLFTGPRGTGKTTTARLLAKALLCQHGPTDEPDGTCEDCLMIADGVHPDVYELDAASRTGVDNVREEIISRVHFAPTRGRYKIYIIDEVHMLSTAAFNALLKTLEEPPDHVVFVLATTDPQKVPETIHSRCQRFDFHSIPTVDIISRLSAICSEEDVDYEPEALEVVAHKAQGGMRNALTGLEQLIAFSEGKVTLSLAEAMFGSITAEDLSTIVQAVGARNAAECFRWVAQYANSGADLAALVNELAGRIRNLYVLKIGGADSILDVGERQREVMNEEVRLFSVDRLARLLGILGELIIELKTSTNARLSLEIALTRMVRPESDLTLEALAERIANLEHGFPGHAAAVPSGGVAPMTPPPAASSYVPAAAHDNLQGARPTQASYQPGNQVANRATTQAQKPPVSTPTPAPAPVGQQPARELTTAPVPSAPTVPAVPQSAMPPAASAAAAQQPHMPTVPPAPATAPVNAAAIPAGYNLENPAALQRMWQSACSIMRQSQAPSSVFFLNTKVTYDAATGTVVVLFPAQNDFVFKQAQKPEVQQSVAQAFSQAYGQSVPFRFEKLQGASASPAPVPAPAPTVPYSRPAGVSQQGFTQGAGSVPPAGGTQQGFSQSEPVQRGGMPQAPLVTPPAAPPTAVPAPAPAAPSAFVGVPSAPSLDDVPPWEEVPYGDEDFYSPGSSNEDIPPFEELPASDSFAAASGSAAQMPPAQTSSVQPPQPPQPAPSMPASQQPTESLPTPQAAGGDVGLNEVQSILAAGFGDGIIVESIDENG